MPWFEYYHEDNHALPGAHKRAELDSLAAKFIKKGKGLLLDNQPLVPEKATPLRNGTNTRYERVANPYPTVTCTQQETPSFARRDNINAQESAACGASPGA